jgi:TRAP-type transport system periplasmic protein
VLGNRDAWAALPSDIRSIVDRNLTKYALTARRETMSLNDRIASGLVQHGMIINTADSAALRARLTASGFYRHWRDQFGSKAWELLEAHTGRLA